MSSFLNIRSSHLEFTKCKKGVPKTLQDSLKKIKNIRDAVFNLKFQAKTFATLLNSSGICAFLRISQKF